MPPSPRRGSPPRYLGPTHPFRNCDPSSDPPRPLPLSAHCRPTHRSVSPSFIQSPRTRCKNFQISLESKSFVDEAKGSKNRFLRTDPGRGAPPAASVTPLVLTLNLWECFCDFDIATAFQQGVCEGMFL